MKINKYSSGIAWTSILALFLTLFINATRGHGNDFLVFYQAAHHYLTGEPLYSFARDGGRCYKYPAFVTPLFLPFSFFSETVAGVLWRLFSLASLFWITWRLRRRKIKIEVIALALIPFWGIWMNNIVSGQSAIFLTALAFAGYEILDQKKYPILAWTILGLSLSMKIFHLFALMGLDKKHWKIKGFWIACVVLIILGLPALAGSHWSLVQLLKNYYQTINTPAGVMNGGTYSFPHFFEFLLGDWISNPAKKWLSQLLALMLVLAVFLITQKDMEEPVYRFASALALSVCLHPLSFQYSFASVYPLAVMVLHHSFRCSRKHQIFALLGILMVTLMSQKTLGPLGGILDLMRIKAWGVVLLVIVLSRIDFKGSKCSGFVVNPIISKA